MGSDDVHEIALADYDSRLRAAEQLVAGEEAERDARRDALLRAGFVGEAVLGGVQQAAAAEVVQDGDAAPGADLHQFARRGGVREADDAEVGRVHG